MPTKTSSRKGRVRDAEKSKRAILEAALAEFSDRGHGAARIDSIAKRSGVSKPMIYSYFGDKDALYTAALREAYVQIRAREQHLDLNGPPERDIRSLVEFTLEHFRTNPWFISMLNTENLRGGSAIRAIEDAADIQTPLINQLRKILKNGAEQGVFRADVDAVDIYITIASLCYFPISNSHTLQVVFDRELNDEWLRNHAQVAADMVIGYLRLGNQAAETTNTKPE